ncbi:MAG: prepilin-type N-terminal cleavage/methylation domain-containing protein [bacterium]
MLKSKKGFTLIELLVVIAIIAILAAILFPVFARAREKARQTTCSSNQRQIAASVQMYAQDHEETLPDAASFWTVLALDPGVVVCPTKGKNTPNGYGFIRNLSGVSVGGVDDPTSEMLTCDAVYAATDSGYTVDSYSKIDGARHSGKFVASYLDGHVAQTTDSPFAVKWNASTKTTNVTIAYPAMTATGTTVGSNLTFGTTGTGAWQVGVTSLATIPANVDGCVQFTPSATGNFMIGLTDSFTPSATDNRTTIRYAAYCNNGVPKIFENGAAVTLNVTATTYSGTNVVTIQRSGKNVTYWVDGTSYYTSLVPSTTKLTVVATSNNDAATATNISFYRFTKL